MTGETVSLKTQLSKTEALAFSVGTAIGWGSFVVTTNFYLLKAGLAGSILGIAAGAVIMYLLCYNFHYMMEKFPYEGGIYTYAKKTLGYDYGFLIAWFLILTYLAMFWANMTSLALFCRYFFGDILRFGPHYQVFGYDVFLPNVSLSIIAIILTSIACSKSRRALPCAMFIMLILISAVIILCTVCALFGLSHSSLTLKPVFVPDVSPFRQVLLVAFLSPWAFIGFECISNVSEEFNFPVKKSGSILKQSVVITTVLYIAVLLLSASAYPPEYDSWISYLRDLDNLKGIMALPGFYAAQYYLGKPGLYLLMAALLFLIITSLIGNMFVTSRLIYGLAKDHVIPSQLGKLNKHNLPSRAVLVVALLSVGIPFLGRTAISWIVDVTTIGATIIYSLFSYTTWVNAKNDSRKKELFTGAAGTVIMAVFLFFLIIPKFFSESSLATESYFLFIVWSVIGLIVFHLILRHDTQRRFGKSTVVWLGLLAFSLLLAIIWMIKTEQSATEAGIQKIDEYIVASRDSIMKFKFDDTHVRMALQGVFTANMMSSFVVVGLFALSCGIILSNFTIMRRREVEHEFELGKAKAAANIDPLTGVKSKHFYTGYVASLDEEIQSDASDHFAIVVCDVNNLKTINDTKGHQAGDEYIKAACHLICVTFSHSPVFRIGGDEFVVILRGHDFDRRHQILEEFNARIEENQSAGGVVIATGLSDFEMGTDRSTAEVFERADFAMYERKKELKGGRA